MEFIPTAVATLAFSKDYIKQLQGSVDNDHHELAKLNGTEVEIMVPLQPAIRRDDILVCIDNPCLMTLRMQWFTNIRSLQDIEKEPQDLGYTIREHIDKGFADA